MSKNTRRSIDVKATILGIIAAIVFIACVVVVLVAQQTTGWPQLFAMLGGLIGLIVLLALYNRKYK